MSSSCTPDRRASCTRRSPSSRPTVTGEIAGGARKIVIDLGGVEYLDSAAIGCLMDLYRQATAAGATLKLAALQRRVETMLTLTGANQFIEIHADTAAAVKSF